MVALVICAAGKIKQHKKSAHRALFCICLILSECFAVFSNNSSSAGQIRKESFDAFHNKLLLLSQWISLFGFDGATIPFM
ncbi:hypothetical protein ACWQEN_001564 [Morganella morganii]|uniref:hypothetical protein n=1 Tax=Morganella morganii TaxID=582 RepID=UPI001E563B49|nr:hypothetical protein [Morganella morganii]UFH69359.1 hypothetical protein KQH80_04785 [Morganella morganii]